MVDDGGGRISLGAVAFILLRALRVYSEFTRTTLGETLVLCPYLTPATSPPEVSFFTKIITLLCRLQH
jgi:hypothetical protein